MVVLIGGEKGGTGKTTIATNLAALQALAGYNVLLVDTDSQGSASYWARSRDEAGITPRVACIQKFGKGMQGEIQNLAGRYHDVIIDAGGRDSVELRAVMIVAHKAFVPIQASQFDIWTLGRMNDLVVTAQGFNPDLTRVGGDQPGLNQSLGNGGRPGGRNPRGVRVSESGDKHDLRSHRLPQSHP